MECTVTWTGPRGMSFMSETSSGHAFLMDGAIEGGGHNLAPRPMEMVLSGAGGCSAYDVVLILKKSRQDIRGCRVQLTAQRADQDPKVFTQIHLQFEITGKALNQGMVERAVALSTEKYCSVLSMLNKTATVTTGISLLEAD